ncbi:unnamed protein product [Triticum turgidum subsp. durum]|uniref:Uncharacterized protein n=1 Tax=Triticum turgidum subsp. durum TaxID=4567 RepID=A0A9R1B819_TRITD|nr:unnamed protein product [Triticum turgidum subsp. durum]
MQPKSGGRLRPRLNTGERPIANKYREGKMKRTLKRESKSRWPKPGGPRCPQWPSSARPVPVHRKACPSGHCAATACGLPIRPVLKHGPRSLTCVRVDGF